ncbi:LapA family protein [Brachybacterium paraconglomeratum]|uniref:LapA family protein n=1 Tax=Brachybacterium paraconglomeratum TaxID=173362 RepID=UPI0021E3D248|nr:lipopolysaccharide assembly protein LapA domain-containing protein [Brachybacterium paraconglomeratum]MCT1437339.1 lipopolysaccharide assembly protein LapA domain-containing protein [Brachybacterium paraconglomeratum]
MTAPDDPARTPGTDGAARPADDPTPTPEATRPADTAPTDRRAAERPAAQDPAQQKDEVPSSGGKTATTWIALILGAIVLVLLLIFVIQNNVSARFQYFGAEFDLPLGVAMLLAAIAGALVMALVGSVRMIQMGWTIRKLRKQQEKVQRTLR